MYRIQAVTKAARAVNSDLSTAVQLPGVSSVLTYLEPISVPWIVERAADMVDTQLEGRSVEVRTHSNVCTFPSNRALLA
jgi:hypothetical protein